MRVRRAHARFLEASRALGRGRSFWDGVPKPARWLLGLLSPVPLLGLDSDGAGLLAALETLERDCRSAPLREPLLRKYHALVLGPEDPRAGVYRHKPAIVTSSRFQRPEPAKLPMLMKQLDSWLAREQDTLDRESSADAVLHLAVAVHQKLAFTHPFADGNGRIARLAMNHVLRRYGGGSVVLPSLDRSPEHMDALERGHAGDLTPLRTLCETCIVRV